MASSSMEAELDSTEDPRYKHAGDTLLRISQTMRDKTPKLLGAARQVPPETRFAVLNAYLSSASTIVASLQTSCRELAKARYYMPANTTRLGQSSHEGVTKSSAHFHCFSRLPAELRLLVWRTAAQPPTCGHYFRSHRWDIMGREPTAIGFPDWGLWTACRESREVIACTYKERRQFLERKSYAICVDPSPGHDSYNCSCVYGCIADGEEIEQWYRRLATLSRTHRLFQERLRTFDERMQRWFVMTGLALPKSMLNDDDVTAVFREVYEVDPEVVLWDGEKLCIEKPLLKPELRKDAFLLPHGLQFGADKTSLLLEPKKKKTENTARINQRHTDCIWLHHTVVPIGIQNARNHKDRTTEDGKSNRKCPVIEWKADEVDEDRKQR